MLIPLTDEIIILHMDNGGKLVTPSQVFESKGPGYICDVIEKLDDVRKRFGKLYLDSAGTIWSSTGPSVHMRVNGYKCS